jgi:putative transposase
LAAWTRIGYHQDIHSETGQAPQNRYQTGAQNPTASRYEPGHRIFYAICGRTVNKTFCDIRINNRYYRVDAKLRGDQVQVRFDPFSTWDKVDIYSADDHYLGTGILWDRSTLTAKNLNSPRQNPNTATSDLLIRQHQNKITEQTGGIDYRKVVEHRPWPFHEFAKTVAQLMGRKAGLADLSTGELESLKKTL